MKTQLNQQQNQTKNLYDEDFNLWLETTANLLKNRQLKVRFFSNKP